MGKYCVAPNCKSGYTADRIKKKKIGRKPPSLFKAPKDPHYFEIWKGVIPHLNRELKLTDHLCELHFKEEDIECYYETNMGNGTVVRMPRGRKLLKPTAIPSIFTNVLEKVEEVKKSESIRPEKVKRKTISHPKMKIELKKLKVPQPTNKDNKIKKNNSPIQPGKENVLMEVVVLQPVPGKSTTTQSFFLKERQPKNIKKLPHSDSQTHVASGSKTSTLTCLDFESNISTESPSNQNMCNKISSKSSTTDNLTNDQFIYKLPMDSSMPDVITGKYSNENSSVRTKTDPMSDVVSTSNENSFIGALIESVPYTVKEIYSNKNGSIGTITKSMIDAVTEKYSNKTYSVRTINKSVPDGVIETHSSAILPDELSDNESHLSDYEKTLCDLSSIKLSEKNSEQNMGDKDRNKTDNNLPEFDSEEEFSFDFLKANVNMFETTNSWWRVNTFDDFVVFSRWTPYYIVERRIVITKDLAVRVFLIDKETTIGCDIEELSLHHISKLIFRVENLRICGGIDKKDSNCVGFLQSVFVCKKYNLCLNCIKWRKEEKKRTLKVVRESANCIELLNFNVIV